MVNDTEYGIIWSRMGQHISVIPCVLLDDELPPLFHRYVSFCAWCFFANHSHHSQSSSHDGLRRQSEVGL